MVAPERDTPRPRQKRCSNNNFCKRNRSLSEQRLVSCFLALSCRVLLAFSSLENRGRKRLMAGVVLCSDKSAKKRQGELLYLAASPRLPRASSPSLKSKQSSVSSLGRRRISSRLLLACSSLEKKGRKRLMSGVVVCSRTSGKERQGGLLCLAASPSRSLL